MAAEVKVDVNIMPRIVFVGDSQTCGCVGAWDYAQMLSWEMPLRVFNRAVGGSNTSHLLGEFGSGTVTVKKGERLVVGEGTSWFAGPYIGMKIRLGKEWYTLDHIETTDYVKRNCNAVLTEPAREDFSGKDYAFEEGWRVRVAEVKPQYACFMYSVNDAGRTSADFKAKLAEIALRCKEAGIQPIFLSGVPMMDADSGGSHPGTKTMAAVRARDLQEFCEAEKLPYGDVYRTLLKLDGHHTATWIDTIHPTTDGSLPALWALRHILSELGVAQNPYYLRGYRAADKTLPDLSAEGLKLEPISTSQPRYNSKKQMSESGFDLEARRVCDEYGLLAEADGQTMGSDNALVLRFGVGEAGAVKSAVLEVVAAGSVSVSAFDWAKGQWREIGSGTGKIEVPLTAAQLQAVNKDGTVSLGLTGEGIELDYAALRLSGDLKPFVAQASTEPILWPTAGQFDWSEEGNLVANGSFAQAQDGLPAGWRQSGNSGLYVANNVVAQGNGDFCGEKRIDQFRLAGGDFKKTVRPLDLLQIDNGPEGCTGNFRVCQTVDDEHVRLRRFAKEAATGVDFRVTRDSGCAAVPGGCAVEADGEAGWETTTESLPAGEYKLSYFCRVYDPAGMTAKARPGAVARVSVVDDKGQVIGASADMDCTYLWQRGEVKIKVAKAGKVTVRLQAAEGERVQYTGVWLGR
ncbi:MAG: SGNH/GDSL hydrolase family protein [Armatimonadota bacterium]